jgi:hypothetical protein
MHQANGHVLARPPCRPEPPTCGDVAEWGADLPAFVRASAQSQEVPCLGDVAALERPLHRAASSPPVDGGLSSRHCTRKHVAVLCLKPLASIA